MERGYLQVFTNCDILRYYRPRGPVAHDNLIFPESIHPSTPLRPRRSVIYISRYIPPFLSILSIHTRAHTHTHILERGAKHVTVADVVERGRVRE